MKFINDVGPVNLICLPVALLFYFVGPVLSVFGQSVTFFDMTFRLGASSSSFVGWIFLLTPILAFVLAGMRQYLFSAICDYVNIVCLFLNLLGLVNTGYGDFSGLLSWGFWVTLLLMCIAAGMTTYQYYADKNGSAQKVNLHFPSKSQNANLSSRLSSLTKPNTQAPRQSVSQQPKVGQMSRTGQVPRVKPRSLPSGSDSSASNTGFQKTAVQKKIYPSCHSEVDADVKFCTECGHRFAENQS